MNKFPTKRMSQSFRILEINKTMPFCNLFMGWLSHYCHNAIIMFLFRYYDHNGVRLLIDSNSLLLFVVCLFFSLKNVFYLLSCGTNLNEKIFWRKNQFCLLYLLVWSVKDWWPNFSLFVRKTHSLHVGTLKLFIPMTHAPETGTINRLHLSGASFWYVCYAYLRLDSSGTRFRLWIEHCSIPSQKLACTWLKWWFVTDYCLFLSIPVSKV